MVAIVTVNVSVQQAPTPNTLQQTGAMLSQGATTTAVNTLSLITQMSDLTSILKGAVAINTITWSASVATVTSTTSLGLTIGDILSLTIVGATPAGYNGTFLCTVTG